MQVKQAALVVSTGGVDYLSKSGLAHRYNVTTRTVDRWKNNKALNFPKADLIVLGRGLDSTLPGRRSWAPKSALGRLQCRRRRLPSRAFPITFHNVVCARHSANSLAQLDSD
jgi:hypothetical protein